MKYVLLAISLTIVASLGYVNYHVGHQPQFIELSKTQVNQDVLKQLNFLREEMRAGAAQSMQLAYPEGFIFLNVMYGLAWCEVALKAQSNDSLANLAHSEIDYVLTEVFSSHARTQFEKNTVLANGAFYAGWTTYLLAKKLESQSAERRSETSIAALKFGCKTIADAIDKNPSPYLESYIGASWPADGFSCIAALAAHDRMFTPAYPEVISKWLDKCTNTLDYRGLIPHSTDVSDGSAIENSMGSSQSLILNFLYEIDPVVGKKYYERFREHFLMSHFYLPAFREYAKGISGSGHVDSGPVIFNVGAAASIVGCRAAYLYGDVGISRAIKNCVNAFAFVNDGQDKRYYLWGQWPMADAFVVWADSVEMNPNDSDELSNVIRPFRWLSLVVTLLLILWIHWKFKK